MKWIYLVITAEGYWGKADTLGKALNEANVLATGTKCSIYRLPADSANNLYCTDSGSASWNWSEKVFNKHWMTQNTDIPLEISNALSDMSKMALIHSGQVYNNPDTIMLGMSKGEDNE